jgi:hypothetical protein
MSCARLQQLLKSIFRSLVLDVHTLGATNVRSDWRDSGRERLLRAIEMGIVNPLSELATWIARYQSQGSSYSGFQALDFHSLQR